MTLRGDSYVEYYQQLLCVVCTLLLPVKLSLYLLQPLRKLVCDLCVLSNQMVTSMFRLD